MADNDRALDTWLRSALTDAYAPVAEERLPDEWVEVIEAKCWE